MTSANQKNAESCPKDLSFFVFKTIFQQEINKLKIGVFNSFSSSFNFYKLSTFVTSYPKHILSGKEYMTTPEVQKLKKACEPLGGTLCMFWKHTLLTLGNFEKIAIIFKSCITG